MEMSHMAPRKLLVTSCWSWYLPRRHGHQRRGRGWGRGRPRGATRERRLLWHEAVLCNGEWGLTRPDAPSRQRLHNFWHRENPHGPNQSKKLNGKGFCFRSDLSPHPNPAACVPGATWRGGESRLMGETAAALQSPRPRRLAAGILLRIPPLPRFGLSPLPRRRPGGTVLSAAPGTDPAKPPARTWLSDSAGRGGERLTRSR